MASLGLFRHYPRKLPSLCHSVRSICPLSFPSWRVHVRVQHVHLAHSFDVHADPAHGLASEEVAFDEVERVPVEGIREDEGGGDGVCGQDREA